jgi:hypothetical protein
MARRDLDLTVLRRGTRVADFTAKADPRDLHQLRQLLIEAMRRDGWRASRIAEFTMEVRDAGKRRLVTTFAASDR